MSGCTPTTASLADCKEAVSAQTDVQREIDPATTETPSELLKRTADPVRSSDHHTPAAAADTEAETTALADTAAGRTAQWIAQHQDVMDLLVEVARERVQALHEPRLRLYSLIEKVRWDYALATGVTDLRILGEYWPHLVREIGVREPSLAGMFTARRKVATS